MPPSAHAVDALARLYAASLDDFVRVRGEIARELRTAGDAAAARRVVEARKPSRTAWALNQVARRSPETLRAVLDAYAKATSVQGRGDAGAVRSALDAHRRRLADAVHAVRDAMKAAGMAPTAAQLRKIGETFQAAAANDAVRAQLLAGRLEGDASIDDPFASLADVEEDEERAAPEAKRAAPEAKRAAPEAKRAAAEAKRAAAERARAAETSRREIEALERSLARARAALSRAEAERARLEREVADLSKKLDAARASSATSSRSPS